MNYQRPARWLFSAGWVAILLAALCGPAYGDTPHQPVVLVLVDELTWEDVKGTPSLEETFEEGAVANLSTAQGAAPAEPGMNYALLGAGSRVDTSLLPENLPQKTTELPEAFDGPASAIRPGAFGEALMKNGVKTAVVGKRAGLVVMDLEGQIQNAYEASEPEGGLEEALKDGAEFVAVDAGTPSEAGRISGTARDTGAVVAIAAPNAHNDSANLTPFALDGPRDGILYSPTTRTGALITSLDVAPTLLAQFDIEPPREMQGQVVYAHPRTIKSAEKLGERLSFVAEGRFQVLLLIGAAMFAGALATILWRGKPAAIYALFVLAALPAAALATAALSLTSVLSVAFPTLFFAGALTGLFRRFSGPTYGAIAGMCLISAAFILADAAFGGTLMKYSVFGYNPAYGTRFYGIGNEYAAFLAGSLTVGGGALAQQWRLPLALLLPIGIAPILVLGLPTMGADVGGSLALGLGFGATVGLLRGTRLRSLVFWTGAGLVPAAALFLTSGLLFPGVSHGSRAAGGETGLAEIIVRKLLLSLDFLLNPAFLPIFVAGMAVVFLAWRRTRGTAFGAGLIGAAITALASGALNDSGILAAIYVLAYPVVAAGIFLLSDSGKLRGVR
ncbi:hypothetical protein BH24ACT22_BH24ACT22_07750 [soil metagenome]